MTHPDTLTKPAAQRAAARHAPTPAKPSGLPVDWMVRDKQGNVWPPGFVPSIEFGYRQTVEHQRKLSALAERRTGVMYERASRGQGRGGA